MRRIVLLTLAVAGASCGPQIGPVVPETDIERKMIGVLSKFDLWDDNGDGYLDRDELARVMTDSPYQPGEIIEFYDRNGDGRISLSEAQAGYSRAGEAEQRFQQ